MQTKRQIILALDGLQLHEAVSVTREVTKRFTDKLYAIKIHHLFDEHDLHAIEALRWYGARKIWVDLKLHDIPATVQKRALAIKRCGADIVSVHASGGVSMLKSAVEVGLEVYAVTVLTSLSKSECLEVYGTEPEMAVKKLAQKAKDAGCAGIVCSPKEVGMLAADPALSGMKFITPGVRSAGVSVDDQSRVNTPKGAIEAGATHLVVGRQIVRAENPAQALEDLLNEIS